MRSRLASSDSSSACSHGGAGCWAIASLNSPLHDAPVRTIRSAASRGSGGGRAPAIASLRPSVGSVPLPWPTGAAGGQSQLQWLVVDLEVRDGPAASERSVWTSPLAVAISLGAGGSRRRRSPPIPPLTADRTVSREWSQSPLRNTALNRSAASMSSPVGTWNSPLVTASLPSSVRTQVTSTELAWESLVTIT